MWILHKSIVRLKTFRLLLTSIRFTAISPTIVYKDNEAIATSVNSHRITPQLRHINILLCYMHNEQTKGLFEVIQTPMRIQIANMDTKAETGLSLFCNSSISIGYVHLKDLPEDQHAILIVPFPISYCKYFRRENS